MKSVLDITVSKYDHYSGLSYDVNLLQYLQDDSLKGKVLQIRGIKSKAERDRLKACLPGITPSAICYPSRSAKNVVKHTGLINFDIDKLPTDKLNEVFEMIKQMPFVIYCELSVSGTGYWGLMQITNRAKHDEHFDAMQLYFKHCGIDTPYFDVAVRDVSRFRFYSYDVNAYFNHQAQTFTFLFEKPKQPNRTIARIFSSTETNPFNDYNLNGDIQSLLITNGWDYQPQSDKGTRRRYCRPGKKHGISADYCTQRKIFYVFSSDPATGFDQPLKGYNHVAVFCQLECNNDWKLCRTKLKQLGFGRA